MIVVADVKEPRALRPLVTLRRTGQQHFAERVRRAQPPGDQPHRPIAIAAQRRLHGGNRLATGPR